MTPTPIPAEAAAERPVLWTEAEEGEELVDVEAAAAAVVVAVVVDDVDGDILEAAIVKDVGEKVAEELEVVKSVRMEADGDDDETLGDELNGDTSGVLPDKIEEGAAGGRELVDDVERGVAEVTGACSSDAIVARASNAGAAHVSSVPVEQSTPVVVSLLQQAHRPVVALYKTSG